MRRIGASRPGIVVLAVVALVITACATAPDGSGSASSPPPNSMIPTASPPGRPPPPASPSPSSTTSATAGSASQCQSPGTVEYATFDDSTQGAVGDYQVYLPPCYRADTADRYPVVYLLHGAGHDDAYWLEVGIVGAADDAIEHGKVAPMIFVMPDGGATFRSGRDGVTFEQFLTDELVPKIDASYRTIATRADRAVGGISMGGGVALTIAAGAPTLFTAVGGHSPAVTDPSAVATALTTGGQRVWLDVGADDFLRLGTVELADQLGALGADVRLEIPAGTHVDSYWTGHLAEYLNFYNESFTPGG